MLLLYNMGKSQHGLCVVYTKPYPKRAGGDGELGKPKLPNTAK